MEKIYKRLSNLMLLANFLANLFYAASYPYIYQQTVSVVPKSYISIEQLLPCLWMIVICKAWNRFSDKLFRFYRIILYLEIICDSILFMHVIITNDLQFYFMLNVIIYSVVTRNLACGGTKMRAIVNPTDKERERFDNNSNIVASASTVIGTGIAAILPLSIRTLFILAFIGNIVDNFIYLKIYSILQLQRRKRNGSFKQSIQK